jgi:pyruvate,water dikinase
MAPIYCGPGPTGDEYWSDVTSPLFFSLLGELLTKYVNHEGSEIMG